LPESNVDFSEVLLVAPAQMIRQMGMAVAEAQQAMDRASMQSQESMPEDMKKLGYQPSWYHMSEIDVELKLAVHYEERGNKAGILISPFNAKYKNLFTYQAEGTSTLKLKIVPVPPPPAFSNIP